MMTRCSIVICAISTTEAPGFPRKAPGIPCGGKAAEADNNRNGNRVTITLFASSALKDGLLHKGERLNNR